jgi:hypothetical protein
MRTYPESLMDLPDHHDGEPERSDKAMNILEIIFAGGWIPQGSRTQWLGTITAICGIVTAAVQWGTGSLDLPHLFNVISNDWPAIVAGWSLVFVGNKIDAHAGDIKDAIDHSAG